MNELIAALILAVVQGITEWLPVSSSGHLVLVERLIGYEGGLNFEIALHFGTLMAVFVYFGKEIVDILRELFSLRFGTPNGKLGLYVIVGSIPAGIVGFLLRDVIGGVGDLRLLALGFMVTGIVLVLGIYAPRRLKPLNGGKAMLIGLAEAFSLLRGISRSGTTIATALWSGMREKDALIFAYLLSVPLILGANVMTVNEPLEASLIWATLVSFFVSLGVMNISFTYILNKRENLRWIALYVFVLALGVGAYAFLG